VALQKFVACAASLAKPDPASQTPHSIKTTRPHNFVGRQKFLLGSHLHLLQHGLRPLDRRSQLSHLLLQRLYPPLVMRQMGLNGRLDGLLEMAAVKNCLHIVASRSQLIPAAGFFVA
jgi:hypothetical protein